ncbi:MAG: hypothetical protein ABW024_10465, partial [Microbacterium sp.]
NPSGSSARPIYDPRMNPPFSVESERLRRELFAIEREIRALIVHRLAHPAGNARQRDRIEDLEARANDIRSALGWPLRHPSPHAFEWAGLLVLLAFVSAVVGALYLIN